VYLLQEELNYILLVPLSLSPTGIKRNGEFIFQTY